MIAFPDETMQYDPAPAAHRDQHLYYPLRAGQESVSMINVYIGITPLSLTTHLSFTFVRMRALFATEDPWSLVAIVYMVDN